MQQRHKAKCLKFHSAVLTYSTQVWWNSYFNANQIYTQGRMPRTILSTFQKSTLIVPKYRQLQKEPFHVFTRRCGCWEDFEALILLSLIPNISQSNQYQVLQSKRLKTTLLTSQTKKKNAQ